MKSLFCLCSHLKSARRFIDLLRPLTLTVRPFKLKAMIGEKSSRIAIQSKCKFDSFFSLDLKYWGSKVWQKTVFSKVLGRICIRLKIINKKWKERRLIYDETRCIYTYTVNNIPEKEKK